LLLYSDKFDLWEKEQKQKEAQIVNLKEVCATLGKSEGTILRNFERT
jgi:predicted DNA-binding transcriptional regulator AlpA